MRDCTRDPLIEPSAEQSLKRICLAKTRYSANLLSTMTRPAARHAGAPRQAVKRLYSDPASRSITSLGTRVCYR
ncbi:MAG: hypothetical protein R3E48_23230 [Burkholderiaceae bacterium]